MMMRRASYYPLTLLTHIWNRRHMSDALGPNVSGLSIVIQTGIVYFTFTRL
jgi:outer membrane protein assembly factor BamB